MQSVSGSPALGLPNSTVSDATPEAEIIPDGTHRPPETGLVTRQAFQGTVSPMLTVRADLLLQVHSFHEAGSCRDKQNSDMFENKIFEFILTLSRYSQKETGQCLLTRLRLWRTYLNVTFLSNPAVEPYRPCLINARPSLHHANRS